MGVGVACSVETLVQHWEVDSDESQPLVKWQAAEVVELSGLEASFVVPL